MTTDFSAFTVDMACRLDLFIAKKGQISRAHAQVLIKGGSVHVNQNIIKKPAYYLQIGESISYSSFPLTKEPERPQKEMFSIVYEDPFLLVINKPAGLIVHPGDQGESYTLMHSLLAYTDVLSTCMGNLRRGIVHRLDKDTEGLMIIAKTNEVHEALIKQFHEHQVKKKYYAAVKGCFKKEYLKIDLPIGRDRCKRNRRSTLHGVSSTMKSACTELRLLKSDTTKSILDVCPLTGRNHQIRVHLEAIGYPVLGDPLYGKVKKGGLKTGQRLQAYFLFFRHPVKRTWMKFELSLSARL